MTAKTADDKHDPEDNRKRQPVTGTRASKAIREALKTATEENGIRIAYACLADSHHGGLWHPVNRYQVRFIYVAPLAGYLGLESPAETIETQLEDDLRVEIIGWELRKTLRELRRGGVQPIEWLHARIVYEDAYGLRATLRAALDAYRTPKRWATEYHRKAAKVLEENGRDGTPGANATPGAKATLTAAVCAARRLQTAKPPTQWPWSANAVEKIISTKSATASTEFARLRRNLQRTGQAEAAQGPSSLRAWTKRELDKPAVNEENRDSQAPLLKRLNHVLHQTVTAAENGGQRPWNARAAS